MDPCLVRAFCVRAFCVRKGFEWDFAFLKNRLLEREFQGFKLTLILNDLTNCLTCFTSLFSAIPLSSQFYFFFFYRLIWLRSELVFAEFNFVDFQSFSAVQFRICPIDRSTFPIAIQMPINSLVALNFRGYSTERLNFMDRLDPIATEVVQSAAKFSVPYRFYAAFSDTLFFWRIKTHSDFAFKTDEFFELLELHRSVRSIQPIRWCTAGRECSREHSLAGEPFDILSAGDYKFQANFLHYRTLQTCSTTSSLLRMIVAEAHDPGLFTLF